MKETFEIPYIIQVSDKFSEKSFGLMFRSLGKLALVNTFLWALISSVFVKASYMLIKYIYILDTTNAKINKSSLIIVKASNFEWNVERAVEKLIKKI